MRFAFRHLLQAWTTYGYTFTEGITAHHPLGSRRRFEAWKEFECASSFRYYGSFIHWATTSGMHPEWTLSSVLGKNSGPDAPWPPQGTASFSMIYKPVVFNFLSWA